MPRRRASQTSLSSEQSISSEQSGNVTVSEELPDPGLKKTRNKNKKKNKNVSFNLNVETNKEIVDLTDDKPASKESVNVNNKIIEKENVCDIANKDTDAQTKKPKSKKSGKKANNDKAATKQQQASERQAKKKETELNKIYKPGECMKYMNIEVHPQLLSEWYMCSVRGEASRASVRVTATDTCDMNAVMWTRTLPREITGHDAVMCVSPRTAPCSVSLYVLHAEEVGRHVAASTLVPHLRHKAQLLAVRLTLVVVGAADYFRKSIRREANGQPHYMSEMDLEMAIIELLVECKTECVLVESASEVAQLVMHYTKAIAEEPYKQCKRAVDEQASYYMRGDNKNCVAVDKQGSGLSRLWQQMLSILPMSSLEVARAITNKYNSPKALMKELSTEEGRSHVRDVGVSRSGVSGARSRRLGPELTRKLTLIFTTNDPDVIVE